MTYGTLLITIRAIKKDILSFLSTTTTTKKNTLDDCRSREPNLGSNKEITAKNVKEITVLYIAF